MLVPYERMREQLELARELFPNAEKLDRAWMPASTHDVGVTVWTRSERDGQLHGQLVVLNRA